jgi:hypothetical protein
VKTLGLDNLRHNRFVTGERVRVYSIISIVLMVLTCVVLLVTSEGNLAYDGKPIGTDFSNVYAAGIMANEGEAARVWDWQAHFAVQNRIHGDGLQAFYGWHYPPFFLLVAAALAALPYLWSLAVWNVAGFVFYACIMARIVGSIRGWLLPVIAFPAIFVNISHGHNGFLTAGLFGLSFLFLDKRPWLAGIFIGLLAYKPQFGVLIPLALLAGGYYRTFLSASVTVISLGVIVTLVYGWEIWPAFFESLELTRNVILEQGVTGWHKIQSVFSVVMLWTGSLTLAYLLQGILTLVVLVVAIIAFRFPSAIEDRAALIITGALLATPYALDYDLVVLAPVIGFLVVRGLREGVADWEALALVLIWFCPLLTRPVMMFSGIPLAFMAMLFLYAIVTKRVIGNLRQEAGETSGTALQP